MMKRTAQDVISFVEENNIKFVRLAFFDVFGVMKNISIMSSELKEAFEHGVSIVPSSIDGFEGTGTDLKLFPDPQTLRVLPWRPHNDGVVRLLCQIRRPDGTVYEGDVRNALKEAVSEAEQAGLEISTGLSCEFYLFKLDENGLPTRIPHDRAGYLDVAPLDKGENIRRRICLTLEEMGIHPLSSHHENGPGQNEIDFRYSDMLSAADDFVSFKSVVKTAAQKEVLYASFLPKPLPDSSGSGMHINLYIRENGQNIFMLQNGQMSKTAQSFIAGVLSHAAEMTVFFNPIPNSYARFGLFKAPDTIDWSFRNLNPLVRLPEAENPSARMDFRSPDSSCNPYLAFTMLIRAGLDGIRQQMPLPPMASAASTSAFLPETLSQASELAKNSRFVRDSLPEIIVSNYLDIISDTVIRSGQGGELKKLMEERYFEII